MYEGREPGVLNIPGVGPIRFDRWVEDVIYDTVSLSAGSISDGTQYKFFTTVTGKNKDDTNMVESGKLPEQWEIIVMKYGLEIAPTATADGAVADLVLADVQTIVENSFFRFTTGNSKIRRRAPTWAWPIGYGVWGVHSADEQAAATTYATPTIGVSSPCAVPTLLIPIRISSRLNFEGILQFEGSGISLSYANRVRCYLYGFISRPIQ